MGNLNDVKGKTESMTQSHRLNNTKNQYSNIACQTSNIYACIDVYEDTELVNNDNEKEDLHLRPSSNKSLSHFCIDENQSSQDFDELSQNSSELTFRSKNSNIMQLVSVSSQNSSSMDLKTKSMNCGYDNEENSEVANNKCTNEFSQNLKNAKTTCLYEVNRNLVSSRFSRRNRRVNIVNYREKGSGDDEFCFSSNDQD